MSNPEGNGSLNRQFKLISVNFKEAALDSPTFRASTNHLDIQVDNIEKWMKALVSSVKKFPRYVTEFQGFSNSFLESLLPAFLQDGLIDQEYTIESLQSTATALGDLWIHTFESLNFEASWIQELSSKISRQIHRYREIKVKFDATQEKFDSYLNIYLAQSKTREPHMVKEDAYNLYEARIAYLHESMELVLALNALNKICDEVLISLCLKVWDNRIGLLASEKVLPNFSDSYRRMKRIQTWSAAYAQADIKLRGDMVKAREQVEESTKEAAYPSADTEDYNVARINGSVLAVCDETAVEKHGYLFMKTMVGKSTKPVWVRRWVFVKDGVMGMLLLSPSQTYVQDSDRIGIMLANIQYTPNEERRFCFQVKTADLTLVFQAERLSDLKSWLKVFENERNRIMRENSEDNLLMNIASNRYPPIVAEFASTVNTKIDKKLSNLRITNSDHQAVVSSKLSSHISKNEKYFKEHVYDYVGKIRTPFTTHNTNSALVSYSLATATIVPTALTANIWGSVNWGLYYIRGGFHEENGETDQTDDSLGIPSHAHNTESGIRYPTSYPHRLVPFDIQMRALMESAIEPGELCLFTFRNIWSPNTSRDLAGRVFVTRYHVYCYVNQSGFLSLFKGNLRVLYSVEVVQNEDHDLLKMYTEDGQVKFRVFLDSGVVIRDKLMFLINNLASEKPASFEEIIGKLDEIEARQKNQVPTPLSTLNTQNSEDLNSTELVANSKSYPTEFKLDFTGKYLFFSRKEYPCSPKTLLHAILGERSTFFSASSLYSTMDKYFRAPWCKHEDGTLTRTFNAPVLAEHKKGELRFEQAIEGSSEDEYYNIVHSKSYLKFAIGSRFKVSTRIVIVGAPNSSSNVYIYARVDCEGKQLTSKIISFLSYRFMRLESMRLNQILARVPKEVGPKGQAIRAIQIYGKIKIGAEDSVVTEEAPTLEFKFGDLVDLLIKKIINLFFGIITFIIVHLIKGVRNLFKSLRMNMFLTFLLISSVLLNLALMGRSTLSYWTVRRAGTIAHKYITKEPMMLQRAIYNKDIQDLVQKKEVELNSTSSHCYEIFKNSSFILNADHPVKWDNDYADDPSRQVARRLRSAFQDVGIQRHELLVKLQLLNQVEKDLVISEYRNWIASEVRRCQYVQESLVHQVAAKEDDLSFLEFSTGMEKLLEHCAACSDEMRTWGVDDTLKGLL